MSDTTPDIRNPVHVEDHVPENPRHPYEYWSFRIWRTDGAAICVTRGKCVGGSATLLRACTLVRRFAEGNIKDGATALACVIGPDGKQVSPWWMKGVCYGKGCVYSRTAIVPKDYSVYVSNEKDEQND